MVWTCWTGALAHLGVVRANTLVARTSHGADADAARVRALAAYKDSLTLGRTPILVFPSTGRPRRRLRSCNSPVILSLVERRTSVESTDGLHTFCIVRLPLTCSLCGKSSSVLTRE
jgi:hypothetical protein